LLFAQQPETKFPAELQELLQGKTSDVSSAASQLKETNLPTALAAVELLKFKALHREIPVNVGQINDFETIIKSRLKNSSVVSFSRTETCRKKVEAKEIQISGRKVLIPQHYVANNNLAVTSVMPAGEAGTIFPDVQVTVFSQSPLTAYSLTIDNKPVPPEKIGLFKDNEEFGLIFRPDLTADSILSIGTHTAEISIVNEANEQVKKQWAFTVGLHDTSTPPLPDGTEIVKELQISPGQILPGCKTVDNFSVIVYQNKNGRRYTSYKLITASGMTIRSRNLAFIARTMDSNKKGFLYLGILPKLSYAFAGNQITFSYLYESSEPGEVIKDTWQIDSGGHIYSDPTIIVLGYTTVKCELLVEHVYTDSNGQVHNYQSVYNPPDRNIKEFQIKSYIYDNAYNINRAFYIGEGTHEFPLSGRVSIVNSIWGNLVEGGEYVDTSGARGILTVNRLRWKAINSEGRPQIKNPVASQTAILFTKPGFAEVAFEVELTWKQDGKSLKSSFKPNVSGLYAFYPATGNVEFKTFHPGQLSSTKRLLEIKNYSVEIKGQKRVVESESDWEFAQPVKLCQSILDPASYPLQVTNAWPAILSSPTSGYPKGRPLIQKSIFSYLTLSASAGEMPLRLFCEFQPHGYYVNTNNLRLVKNLPSITVYNSTDVMETTLHPAEVSSIQEGQQLKFSAAVRPKSGLGEGSLSSSTKDLNVLDGYKFNRLRFIRWIERPLFQNNNGEVIEEGSSFTHVFKAQSGVGSYSLDCNAYLYLEDSETNKVWGRYVPSSNPVEVTPGLRILSPIDKLAYPLNRTVRVTTTMDAEEQIDQWERIEWKLNGEKFVPPSEKPAFPLFLNKTGKWKLEAQLKTEDPNTGEEITLYDSAEFEVKPIEISLTPARKVLDFKTDKNYEIKASVLVNGTEIQKPGEVVSWQENSTKIVVDSIAWNLVTDPDKCAALTPVPKTLKANCEFANVGATTALATVTVRIIGAKKLFDKKHKGFNDKFEEQIFEIPAGRADLWAVKPPTWFNTTGKTAGRAIQNTNRLFSLVSGQIKFYGREYSWDNNSAFADKIKIPAAIPNISPLTSVGVKFAWSGPDEQSSETPEFKPDFKNSGSQEVIMGSAIEFDSGDNIKFEKDKTDVKVEPLSKVIYVKVMANPSSVGKNQPSQVSLSFGEINGAMDSQTQLDIWDGEYNLKLTKVNWSYSGGVLTPTGENDANAKFSSSDAGQFKISGTPNFSVKPLDCDEVDMALNPGETLVKVLGSLIGIKVDNTLPDHLKKIRYATDPGNDIYDKSNNRIWNRTDTQPLVVACNSTITLIPEFEGQKKHKVRDGVTFQWFDSDGLLALSGNTDLDDKIEFPTPTVVDKYALKLGFDVTGETIEIPETYTVKKITETTKDTIGTTDLVYYIKCIKDSISALKGKNSSTPDKVMIDEFYEWWWSDLNALTYNKPAHYADQVILLDGGMCQGLADFFAMCLQCQGVPGIERFQMLLDDTIIPFQAPAKSLKSPFPKSQEYWGAVVYTDHGLNCKIDDMPPPLPWKGDQFGEHAYTYSGLKFYTAPKHPLPYEAAEETTIIYGGPHNQVDENIECPNVYVFRAPKDGHVIVRYKTEEKSFMYDPSFGEGWHKGELDLFPELSDIDWACVVIKHYRENSARKPELWQYFKNSIGWLRGFIPYFAKHSDIPHGITVFDVPPESINFLYLRIRSDKDLLKKNY
jgi:hypothetical protein